MPRVFVPHSQVYDDEIVILDQEAHRIITAFGLKEGDRLFVCDMQKTDYTCRVSSTMEGIVRAKILSSEPSRAEFNARIRLFQAIPQDDSFASIVGQAVELGVSEIVPVITERSFAKSDLVKNKKKAVDRYREMAYDIAESCGRGIVPVIGNPISLDAALETAHSDSLSLFCYEGAQEYPLKSVLRSQPDNMTSLSFFIGPDKGFSSAEVQKAQDAGVKPVSLGSRILSCKTAVDYVLSCLSFTQE